MQYKEQQQKQQQTIATTTIHSRSSSIANELNKSINQCSMKDDRVLASMLTIVLSSC